MERLTAQYRISDTNLALRKEFVRFRDSDVRVLARLAKWAEKVADPIAREFYDHQFAFGPTRSFFEAQARRKNVSLDELRRQLEGKQAGYFRDIFREATTSGRFGADYIERRLVVGKLHNVINLPLKWYVGSYAYYQELVRKHLRRSFPLRPGLRAHAERAIFAVFNYDIQAVADAFFYDYLQSIGLDLTAIDVSDPNHDLSEYYSDLKTAVRDTLIETGNVSRVLSELSAALNSAASQTGLATQQVASTIQQVAAGAAEQARAASETADAVQSLTAIIRQVGTGSAETSQKVETTGSTIHKMTGAIEAASAAATEVDQVSASAASAAEGGAMAVKETVSGMARIKTAVEASAVKVTELGAKGEQIGAIVETIDDIADQTNLLALNAAIEAARAGEQGKGFAVVADEVRKLAERSGRATKEIAALIAEVQAGTSEAVKAMEVGAGEVATGAELAARSGAALEQIAEAVSATRAAVGRITQAVNAMAGSSSEVVAAMDDIAAIAVRNNDGARTMSENATSVSRAVESIAAVSEENSAAAEQVSAATEQMSAQATEVVSSASQLREMATTLERLVERFQLSELEESSQERPRGVERRATERRSRAA